MESRRGVGSRQSAVHHLAVSTDDTLLLHRTSLQAPNNDLSKKTPHLTAIISRAASHTRKEVPFKFNPRTPSNTTSQHSTWEYRPSSIPECLSRLATFKLATYANKPPEIDAVAAAKCGWINDGKDRLVCGMCNVSWVVGGRESMARDAGTTTGWVDRRNAKLSFSQCIDREAKEFTD